MYKLTLMARERKAIDWVGNRYAHGDDLYNILADYLPEDREWGDEGDITFEVRESAAWHIGDIGEECNYLWDCFAPSLAGKLNEFCDSLV